MARRYQFNWIEETQIEQRMLAIKPRSIKLSTATVRKICNGTSTEPYRGEPQLPVRAGSMRAYSLPSRGFRT